MENKFEEIKNYSLDIIKNSEWIPEALVAKLVEEVGELSEAVIYTRKKFGMDYKILPDNAVYKELVDVFSVSVVLGMSICPESMDINSMLENSHIIIKDWAEFSKTGKPTDRKKRQWDSEGRNDTIR